MAPAHCMQEVTTNVFQMLEDSWFSNLGQWHWAMKLLHATSLDFYVDEQF